MNSTTRSLLAAAMTAALVLPASASPQHDPRPPAPILRGSECLDPAYARSFRDLDDHSLVVDAGRNLYRIEVSCWNLKVANVIGFRGDPVIGRICGGPTDSLLVSGSPPCPIRRMELISKDQYDQAIRDRDEWRRARKAERAAAKSH